MCHISFGLEHVDYVIKIYLRTTFTETIKMTDHTQALESQVGGHPGVLSSEDGSLIIKPSLHSEFDFYQTVSSDDEYISLRSVIPRFYGMLKLEGKVNPDDETLVPLPDENGSSPQKDKL